MRRTIVKSARMGEEYLRLEHESGLVILFYPMKGFRTAYAIFGTKYGSVDSEFKTPEDEDFVKVPDGVAHYLEHKLFESEEGSVDRLFAGAGAEANAFTSFDKTCYLFSCTDRFEESFRYLLRFVQDPYFGDRGEGAGHHRTGDPDVRRQSGLAGDAEPFNGALCGESGASGHRRHSGEHFKDHAGAFVSLLPDVL